MASTIREASLSTALLTDRYELTMLDAALQAGVADRDCVFEVFARELPVGRRYGVVAGLGRLLSALGDFRFDEPTLAWLDDAHVVSPGALSWLAAYRFRGDVHAYREGELYVPDTPVLTVSAPFAEGVVLETLVLSVLNLDSAVASAGARIVAAADGRGLLEFGSRRAHEEAAVAAARAAYVVGFDGSSNLAAGVRHGVPTLGTLAHAFVLLHDDERSAFQHQVAAFGPDTTILIDTYDIGHGIDLALEAAGPSLGAIRIDSGDLGEEARAARVRLDAAGATGTRIVVSGDLDEYRIQGLKNAPIDAFGVGTKLVTGSGAPTAGFVYKLVSRARAAGRPCAPVAKAGGRKATIGGRKIASRRLVDGVATAEVLRDWNVPPAADERALQVPVLVDGELLHDPDLDAIRAHHRSVLTELPDHARDLSPGGPGWSIAEEAEP